MLRITRSAGEGPAEETLKLEGKLVGPWVAALRETCGGSRPRLDLGAVEFVDAAGLALLRELIAGGATLASCSALVAEMLHPEV
jgi:hypothetical protein